MKKMLNKLFIEKTNDVKIQFLRYIFVGGIAAVVNIGALYIFTDVFHLYYLVSNIFGFILGLITNYLLSKVLVFAKEKKFNKIIEFTIYAIIGVIGFGLYYFLSKIISTALVFIWNFGARKVLYIIAGKISKRGEE